jgi:hypothetical protein
VGVCYKNIVEKSNYEFKFNDLGHGCYLISGNAGTWSHSDPDFNNVVKVIFIFIKGILFQTRRLYYMCCIQR